MTMTRQEARNRREQIALAMRKRNNVCAVAEEFKVSTPLVRKSCREFGVACDPAEPSPRIRISKAAVTADLRVGKSADAVAKQHNVSVKRVVRLQQRIVSGMPSKRK